MCIMMLYVLVGISLSHFNGSGIKGYLSTVLALVICIYPCSLAVYHVDLPECKEHCCSSCLPALKFIHLCMPLTSSNTTQWTNPLLFYVATLLVGLQKVVLMRSQLELQWFQNQPHSYILQLLFAGLYYTWPIKLFSITVNSTSIHICQWPLQYT